MSFHKENMTINGFGDKKGESGMHFIRHGKIVNSQNESTPVKVQLVETETITCNLKRQPVPEHFFKHKYTKGLRFAEDYSVENNDDIDVLIGMDYYWSFITGKIKRQLNKPVIIESVLGWIIQGNIESQNDHFNTMFCSSKNEDNELNKDIKKLEERF